MPANAFLQGVAKSPAPAKDAPLATQGESSSNHPMLDVFNFHTYTKKGKKVPRARKPLDAKATRAKAALMARHKARLDKKREIKDKDGNVVGKRPAYVSPATRLALAKRALLSRYLATRRAQTPYSPLSSALAQRRAALQRSISPYYPRTGYGLGSYGRRY